MMAEFMRVYEMHLDTTGSLKHDIYKYFHGDLLMNHNTAPQKRTEDEIWFMDHSSPTFELMEQNSQ